jgi:ABC-type branched-subunit amino acid transport system permease subunit
MSAIARAIDLKERWQSGVLSAEMWIAGSVLAASLVAAVCFPAVAEVYTIISATIFVSLCILSLSLGLVWGYGGVFCLGQAAFFGLGGYAYAIASINFESTTMGILCSLLIPMLFAAALGYFIFWGKIGDVYIGVITLTVTLIFSQLLNGSAGDEYVIGSVPLGGFNGIPAAPQLTLPGSSETLSTDVIFGVAIVSLALAYAVCRVFLASRTGKVMVAIRENETRAELLGYDSRVVKLSTFILGAGIAGIAGMIFANCLTVTPNMFSLSNTAQIVIWVLIGGRGTLLGPLLGCLFIQLISTKLGTSGILNPEVVLGAILIFFVMFVPSGLVPALQNVFVRMGRRMKGKQQCQ